MVSYLYLVLAIISYVGVESSPYYLILLQYISYRITMTPLQASFQEKPVKHHDQDTSVFTIVGSIASIIHTHVLLGLPCMMYICLHYRTIVSWIGLSDVILLICIPILLFATMIHQGMWISIMKHVLSVYMLSCEAT